MDVPDEYLLQPMPEAGDEFFLTAFKRLRRGNSGGMGASPIPWTQMRDYAMAHDYAHPNDFYAIIEAMDSAFFKFEAEKQAKANRESQSRQISANAKGVRR